MKITFKWKFIVACILLEVLVLVLIAGVTSEIADPYIEQAAQQRFQQLKSCLVNRLDLQRTNLKVEEIASLMHTCHTEDSVSYFVLFDQSDKIIRKNGWP